MLRLDAASSRELQAVILGLRRSTTEVQRQVRQHTKRIAQPAWTEAVRGFTSTRLETRVLGDTARAFPSNQNVRLTVAGTGRALSGGAKPSQLYPAVEFGASEKRSTYQAQSKRGKNYSVTRNTRAQFKPRNRSGYAVFPAARLMVPRIAALWVQTTVRTFHEVFEGKL